MTRLLLQLTAISTFTCGSIASAQTTSALVGGTLVDPRSASIPNASIIVRDGRIVCAGTRAKCPAPSGARIVDVTGKFITPGLIDAHVHFSQTGWIDGRPDGLSAPAIYPYAETARSLRAQPERWYRSYLCTGITAVYDVGGHPWTTQLPGKAEPDPMAPHVR